MKEQDFDRLFRDNLAGYQQTPPSALSEKLEQKLKNRRRGAWLQFSRLAAVLVVIAICVYLVSIWRAGQLAEPISPIAHNQPQAISPIEDKQLVPETIELPAPVIESQPTLEVKPEVSKRETPQPKESNSLEKNKTTTHSPSEPEAQMQPVNDAIELTEANGNVEQEAVKRGKVTITYKKATPPPPTQMALKEQPEKKAKGLNRLWKRAQKVDYQNISLAAIRATKDELLAINKKDKNKQTKPN